MSRTTVLLVVSLLATLWLACRANNCKAIFNQNPANKTVQVGQEGVNITCNTTEMHLWTWRHTLENELVSTSASASGYRPFSVTGQGVLYFNNPVIIRNHGSYQCVVAGCGVSIKGQLNVAGVPLVDFSITPMENNQAFINAMAGENIERRIYTFGYPTPNVTIRRKIGDSYTTVTGVTINTELLMINNVERSDSGDYQIVATNTYGSYMLNFTLNITGVASPCPVTIIPMSSDVSAEYNSQVLLSCSTPEEAYDSNDNQFMIQWNSSKGVISSDNSFEITQPVPTQLNVTIKSLTSDLNGLYTCFAANTRGNCMKQVMVIGPPARINSLMAETLPDAHVKLSWSRPDAFGAIVSKYEIKYRSSNGSPGIISVDQDPSSSSMQTHTQRFCPHGVYHFKVAAVNEHNSTSEYSEEHVAVIPESDCSQPVVPNSSGTTGGSANTNSPNMTPTMTLRIENPAPGPTTAIIAGSVAGLALLAIAIVVVMLTYCYVGVFRKRFSGRHEWSVRGESPDMPVSSPPYDGKSPEPNGILAGLPSPIPLDGNGYMPAPYANSNIDPRFEFPRENLEFTDVLFDGRQTVIYKAAARGIKDDRCIDVAVKAIKEEFTVYDEYVSALLLEMEELAQLEPHPNVVGLIRVCTVGRPLYMVMEYMCHGDLLGFLRSTRGHENMYTVLPCNDNPPIHLKLTSRDLLRIATQISCGMQFLSERKIVHGALCARNILVSNSMEVKVFNIGCHNLYNEEPFESLEKWLAPENISNGQRTTYGDVWSYGVLLWEVVTVGGTPYSEINSEDLLEQLQAGMRLPRPPHCAQPVYNIMEECWKAFPQDRPLFSDIYDSLDHLNLSKMSYLDLRSYDKTAYSQFDNEMSLTSAL